MQKKLNSRFRLLAGLGTLLLIGLMWLYVYEFPVFFNTIGIRWLILGSIGGAALGAALLVFGLRHRLLPWERHWPEIVAIVFPLLFFAPLAGSLLNRAIGTSSFQSFDFVAEAPYVASGYGFLEGEEIKPTGYYLTVREKGKLYRFQYKSQSYYPITRDGDKVLLPVKKGWLGFRVIQLR